MNLTTVQGARGYVTPAVLRISDVEMEVDCFEVEVYKGKIKDGEEEWTVTWRGVKPVNVEWPHMGGSVSVQKAIQSEEEPYETRVFTITFQFDSIIGSIHTILKRGDNELERERNDSEEKMVTFSASERKDHTERAFLKLSLALENARQKGQTD